MTFESLIIIRGIIALVLGSLIGIERRSSGKSAGLRTFALVSLGASLFSGLAIYAFQIFGDGVVMNIAANIVIGIGFIGAGIIIVRDRGQVQGLTTAASLWVAAGIGMLSGFGLYMAALAVAVMSLLVLMIFHPLEEKIINHIHPDTQEDTHDENDANETL